MNGLRALETIGGIEFYELERHCEDVKTHCEYEYNTIKRELNVLQILKEKDIDLDSIKDDIINNLPFYKDTNKSMDDFYKVVRENSNYTFWEMANEMPIKYEKYNLPTIEEIKLIVEYLTQNKGR